MQVREGGDVGHRVAERGRAHELNRRRRLVEHLRRGELGVVAREVRARGFRHLRLCRVRGGAGGGHHGHGLVPGPDEGLAEPLVLEGLGIDDQHVDDLARNPGRVKNGAHVRHGLHFGEQRVPGHDRGDVVRRERGDDVRVGGIHHRQVALGHAGARERAGEQVVRHGEFHEVHVLPPQIRDRLAGALQHDAVVAVREVAHDERCRVDAPGGRDRQGVHVGHGAAVEGPDRVLVDGLDVVVELDHLDGDAVLLGPLVDDAGTLRVVPRHPADVDAPGDAVVVLRE